MVLARGLAVACLAYVPRPGNGTVLQAVVREHLESLLAEVSVGGDGHTLPRFVEREFRDFLGCGVLARGFARVRCAAWRSSGSCRSRARGAASVRAAAAGG